MYTHAEIQAYIEATGCDLERAIYHFEHTERCVSRHVYEGDHYEDDNGFSADLASDRMQYGRSHDMHE